ncbi:hypothetical protein DAI22_11g223600 [Oryza sativa Japonica Group]|nr:uncharacterized protein LOC107276475 isoform X3 [Oryza sativa Japonica Group]KAF2912007.1 hypothetical protein DAI22_11g223600 [Oryza sativa Japonica Group]
MPVAWPQDREEKDGKGDEGSRGSPPAKRPRSSCGFDDKQTYMLQEILRMTQQQNERMDYLFREIQELVEKVSSLTAVRSGFGGYHQQIAAPSRMLSDDSDQNCTVPLRLQFVNSCSNDKYSTHKIEADDENPLQVAIYDHNDKIVTMEPFSSMRVHIVAIDGDFDDDNKGQWTKEYFHSKIVPGRPHKGHLLSGKLYFRLQNGVGYLNSAKFQDNSSFVPSRKFKLGVMAADERISVRIQEGVTESFAVKDVRGYLTKKNPNPSPRDAVYKLSKIAKNGDRHKLLEQNGIKTVEDFLSFYNNSEYDLRKILGKISDQDWDLIIAHAQKCRPGVYSSCLKESSVSHEHEALSIRNDSYCLQESFSMQPSHTLQGMHPQISSTYDGSVGLSDIGVPYRFQPDTLDKNLMHHGQLEGIQVVIDPHVPSVESVDMPVSSMDNSTLEVFSSQQQHSFKCNNTPELGNGLSQVNSFDWNLDCLDGDVDVNALWGSKEDFPSENMGQGGHVYTETPGPGGSYSAAEQNLGHLSVSEAGSISYNEISAVNEAGSWSHRSLSTPPPVRGAASMRNRGISFSSPRGTGGRRGTGRWRRAEGSGDYGTDNISNTSTYFTGEEQ